MDESDKNVLLLFLWSSIYFSVSGCQVEGLLHHLCHIFQGEYELLNGIYFDEGEQMFSLLC